jgi:hypothetical protein
MSTLQAFEAHPLSEFCVGGVYTRRSPFPSFQVLSRALLKTASDSLLGSRYYDRFTPAMLKMVGMPRDESQAERLDDLDSRSGLSLPGSSYRAMRDCRFSVTDMRVKQRALARWHHGCSMVSYRNNTRSTPDAPGHEGAMTEAIVARDSSSGGGSRRDLGPAGQISGAGRSDDSAAKTTPPAKTVPAAKSDAAMGQHTMEGTVTKVNPKKGWVDVKTSEGSMKLHFPTAALEKRQGGDSVTVELGMTRTAMKKTSANTK